MHPVAVAEPLQGDLHDREGHLGEVEELLVAVDPRAQVDLGDPVQPERVEDVDEHPHLDPIAGEEGQLFE